MKSQESKSYESERTSAEEKNYLCHHSVIVLRIKRSRLTPPRFDWSKFVNVVCAARYDRFLKIKWIMDKGFFNPPKFFKTEIQRKGWRNFNKHPKRGYAVIVREFYANLTEQEEYKVFVRGKKVLFDRHTINGVYKLPVFDNSAYQQLVATPDYKVIINYLTKNRGSWKRNNKNEHINFQTKHLTTMC